MKQLLVIILFLGIYANAIADDGKLMIRLFSTSISASTKVKVTSGHYYLLALSKNKKVIDTIAKVTSANGNSLLFNYYRLRIKVRKSNSELGWYGNIELRAANNKSSFSVVYGNEFKRNYNGSLLIYPKKKNLEVINKIDIERYVAGVVKSEVGVNRSAEFYKVQSILVRTYAIKNRNKFIADGYHLTDDVRSQVYFSKCDLPIINKAVNITKGKVVVDKKNNLILAAFHANSGGQTINSGDAWVRELPYLLSKKDPFSVQTDEGTAWSVTMDKNEYLNYFLKNAPQYSKNKKFKEAVLNFSQVNRRPNFVYKNFKIKLKTIRLQFKLRSSFFSVIPKGNKVVLKGKGYGHGVGLSQVGASNMAEEGYSYQKIIKFYYTGVQIKNYSL